MADQPATVAESFQGLQTAFLPDRAASVNKTIQCDFTGAEPGTWSMTIANGAFSYAHAAAENQNATVTVDSDDWLKLLHGDLNPMTAVISGRLKIKGEMTLLAQFPTWFQQQS